MKRITVVIGNPRSGSFSHSLAESYLNSAREGGAEVKVIDLAASNFPLMSLDSHKAENEQPDSQLAISGDLQLMIDALKWADHLVFVHPVWWGTYPAVFKDFIDSAFLPGVAFKYRSDGSGWDKLFKGKTARIIYTMDAPSWFNRFWYRRPAENSLRYAILWYCGVKTIGAHNFTPVRKSTVEQRQKWVTKASELGSRDAKA